MKILRRYFFKEFFKIFAIVILSATAILLVAEFFDKLDEFYEKKAPIHLIINYLFLQAPKSLLIISPIASLLSILFTISIASKWKETVAIKAAGGSLKKLFSFFLIIGIIITISVLIFGETLATKAARRASYVRNVKILRRPSKIIYREGALWIKGLDGSLIRIMDFVEDKNRILKVSIFRFNPSFELIERIEADGAEWIHGRWELKNAEVFDISNSVLIKHDALGFKGLEEPAIFREEMIKPEEMNFFELYSYYKRLENAGFKNLRYLMELYGKFAYPTVNFVMILFGLALSLNARVGGGLRAAGLGLVVVIVYWLIFSICISLGYAGIVPPPFAPWISPAIFGIAGGYMFAKIKD